MSVVILLQNLPKAATSADIRRFFGGLHIPHGGIFIVGGKSGDAFVVFASDEDARLAMRENGCKIMESRVKLYLSSHKEMQQEIDLIERKNPTTSRQRSLGGRQTDDRIRFDERIDGDKDYHSRPLSRKDYDYSQRSPSPEEYGRTGRCPVINDYGDSYYREDVGRITEDPDNYSHQSLVRRSPSPKRKDNGDSYRSLKRSRRDYSTDYSSSTFKRTRSRSKSLEKSWSLRRRSKSPELSFATRFRSTPEYRNPERQNIGIPYSHHRAMSPPGIDSYELNYPSRYRKDDSPPHSRILSDSIRYRASERQSRSPEMSSSPRRRFRRLSESPEMLYESARSRSPSERSHERQTRKLLNYRSSRRSPLARMSRSPGLIPDIRLLESAKNKKKRDDEALSFEQTISKAVALVNSVKLQHQSMNDLQLMTNENPFGRNDLSIHTNNDFSILPTTINAPNRFTTSSQSLGNLMNFPSHLNISPMVNLTKQLPIPTITSRRPVPFATKPTTKSIKSTKPVHSTTKSHSLSATSVTPVLSTTKTLISSTLNVKPVPSTTSVKPVTSTKSTKPAPSTTSAKPSTPTIIPKLVPTTTSAKASIPSTASANASTPSTTSAKPSTTTIIPKLVPTTTSVKPAPPTTSVKPALSTTSVKPAPSNTSVKLVPSTTSVKPALSTTSVKPAPSNTSVKLVPSTTSVKPVASTSVKPVASTSVKPVASTSVKPVASTSEKSIPSTTSVKPTTTSVKPVLSTASAMPAPSTTSVNSAPTTTRLKPLQASENPPTYSTTSVKPVLFTPKPPISCTTGMSMCMYGNVHVRECTCVIYSPSATKPLTPTINLKPGPFISTPPKYKKPKVKKSKNPFVVTMSGLDPNISSRQLQHTLSGIFIPERNIKFDLDKNGSKTGIVYIKLCNLHDYNQLLSHPSYSYKYKLLKVSASSIDVSKQHFKPKGTIKGSLNSDKGIFYYTIEGLPSEVTCQDILDFFENLEVVDLYIVYLKDLRGFRILNKASGTAYIAFGNKYDFQQAFLMNGLNFGGTNNIIYLKKIPTKLVKKIKVNNKDTLRDSASFVPVQTGSLAVCSDEQPFCILITGLPENVTKEQMFGFFVRYGSRPGLIHILFDDMRKPNGQAFVQFKLQRDHMRACKIIDGKNMKSNTVTVKNISYDEMLKGLELQKSGQPSQPAIPNCSKNPVVCLDKSKENLNLQVKPPDAEAPNSTKPSGVRQDKFEKKSCTPVKPAPPTISAKLDPSTSVKPVASTSEKHVPSTTSANLVPSTTNAKSDPPFTTSAKLVSSTSVNPVPSTTNAKPDLSTTSVKPATSTTSAKLVPSTSVKPVASTSVKPVASISVKPVAPTSVKPVAPTSVKPVAPTSVKPVAPTSVKPVAPTSVKPVASTSVKPVASTSAKSVLSTTSAKLVLSTTSAKPVLSTTSTKTAPSTTSVNSLPSTTSVNSLPSTTSVNSVPSTTSVNSVPSTTSLKPLLTSENPPTPSTTSVKPVLFTPTPPMSRTTGVTSLPSATKPLTPTINLRSGPFISTPPKYKKPSVKKGKNPLVVTMSGLDPKISPMQLQHILSGIFIPERNMKFELDKNGSKTGTVYIKLCNVHDYNQLLSHPSYSYKYKLLKVSASSIDISNRLFKPEWTSKGSLISVKGFFYYMIEGLPSEVTCQDILNFFENLEVVDLYIVYLKDLRSVRILNKVSGTAYIAFGNKYDFQQAFLMNGLNFGFTNNIIYLTKMTTKLVKRIKVNNRDTLRDSTSFVPVQTESLAVSADEQPFCILITGLPENVTKEQMFGFFVRYGSRPGLIHILFDDMRKPNGQAFVQFKLQRDHMRACKTIDGKNMKSNTVTVKNISYDEMLKGLELQKSGQPSQPGIPNCSKNPVVCLDKSKENLNLQVKPSEAEASNSTKPSGVRQDKSEKKSCTPVKPLQTVSLVNSKESGVYRDSSKKSPGKQINQSPIETSGDLQQPDICLDITDENTSTQVKPSQTETTSNSKLPGVCRDKSEDLSKPVKPLKTEISNSSQPLDVCSDKSDKTSTNEVQLENSKQSQNDSVGCSDKNNLQVTNKKKLQNSSRPSKVQLKPHLKKRMNTKFGWPDNKRLKRNFLKGSKPTPFEPRLSFNHGHEFQEYPNMRQRMDNPRHCPLPSFRPYSESQPYEIDEDVMPMRHDYDDLGGPLPHSSHYSDLHPLEFDEDVMPMRHDFDDLGGPLPHSSHYSDLHPLEFDEDVMPMRHDYDDLGGPSPHSSHYSDLHPLLFEEGVMAMRNDCNVLDEPPFVRYSEPPSRGMNTNEETVVQMRNIHTALGSKELLDELLSGFGVGEKDIIRRYEHTRPTRDVNVIFRNRRDADRAIGTLNGTFLKGCRVYMFLVN